MNVAEQIVAQLVDAEVHRIYGIVGDSLNPIVDAVRKTGGSKKGGIDWIHVRHEEAAAFAASAEAQLTGKLAVCAGSCGPGNLHLINGLYDANGTGAPVLAIASHIPSVQIGSTYFQETHPDRIFEECSVYNELISSAAQSPRTVNSAIRHAVGLGGVSVITLPGDVSDLKAVEHVPTYAPARPATLAPNPADIDEAAALLNKADKVAIFAGAGVEGAHDEVIALAVESLAAISPDYVLDVSHVGLVSGFMEAAGVEEADYPEVMAAVRAKNLAALGEFCRRKGLSGTVQALLERLVTTYGTMDTVLAELAPLCVGGKKTREAWEELSSLCTLLKANGLGDKVYLDFSVEGDVNYYSGLVFRGFLKNLAAGVLSGGQYDKMVEKMGKRCGAMGFAIYLNELERLGPARPQYDADVLVLYDDTTDLQALTRRLAALAGQGKRALARRQAEGLQGKETLDLRGGKQA